MPSQSRTSVFDPRTFRSQARPLLFVPENGLLCTGDRRHQLVDAGTKPILPGCGFGFGVTEEEHFVDLGLASKAKPSKVLSTGTPAYLILRSAAVVRCSPATSCNRKAA